MTCILGGYGDGGGQSMERSDCVFVAGLPTTASEQEIAEFFGSIGIVKVLLLLPNNIFYFYNLSFQFVLYLNRLTGELENPKFGCTRIK